MKKNIGIIKPLNKPAYYDAVLSAVNNINDSNITEIDWENFDLTGNDLIVFPEPNTVPFGTGETVDRYLKQGGNIVTLGGPAMTEVLHKTDEGWLPREVLTPEQGRYEGRHIIWDFEKPEDATGWSRNACTTDNIHQVNVGDYSSPDSKGALHVKIEGYKGWDMLGKAVNLPAGYSNVGLYVRGDKNTRSLAVQLTEKDGSVWIATLGLKEEWRFVSLPNYSFHYWFDNPSKGRGGAGDRVNFENVSSISVGLSHSHLGISSGDYQFWIDSIMLHNLEIPEIDELSPQWKFYPITNGEKAVVFDNQCVVSERSYHLPSKLFSPSPRAQGTGFGKNRKARFIPLLEVYDNKNLRSGILAWIIINHTADPNMKLNPYEGSVIAGFGTSDPEFYNADGLAALSEVIEFILRGKMFVEAGASEYLYIDSETSDYQVGAHLKGDLEGLTVKMALLQGEKVLLNRDYTDVNSKIADEITSTDQKPDKIVFSLYDVDKKIDEIAHELVFWSPKSIEERHYITAKNNEFMRFGKPLRMFGVSYMPVSNIAFSEPNGSYDWEHYQSLSSYDPDVCRKDIARIVEVGFNAIALYVYHDVAMQTKNILHLLDMCDKAGLVVDFALRSYFPLEHDPDDTSITNIIKVLHLNELDYISGYDIGWEQCVGRYIGSYGSVSGGRRTLDPHWIKWVEKRYGSVEIAERIWGEPMPKTRDGAYTCPSDAALEVDFKASILVNDYRKFIDYFVAKKHNIFRNMIHSVDPHHMISARTNYSGIPLFDPAAMAFDFKSLAPAFDYMSPEYYGNKENIYRNVFTNVYARYAKPDAPVVWKEFGYRVWCGSNFPEMASKEYYDAFEKQGEFVDEFYKTIIKGHTGAVYFWFWAPGYRPYENTDHGVTNPDGSDRPVTKSIRYWRDKFLNQPVLPKPDVLFEINRDKHPSGIRGIYLKIEKEFQKAIDDGKTVAFIDAKSKN